MDRTTRWQIVQIIIFIIVIIGIIFIFFEFRKIDDAGMECINEPFVYGTNKMIEKDMSYYKFEVESQGQILDCECSKSSKKGWLYEN